MKRLSTINLALALVLISSVTIADEHEGLGMEMLTELMDNAEYKLEVYSVLFPKKPSRDNVDDSPLGLWSRITMDSAIDLNDEWAFEYSLYAGFSTQRKEMSKLFQNQFDKTQRPSYIDFNSVTASMEGDEHSLLFGKEEIDIGYSEIYSPVNVFGRDNLANPLHVKDVGVWQASGSYFIEDDTLSGKIMPFELHSYVPPEVSRWYGDSPNYNFHDSTVSSDADITYKYHKTEPQNFGYLAQYEGAREGYDFFVSLYHGPSPYYVLKEDNTANNSYQIERVLVLAPALGVSATIEEWALYGEAIYQQAEGDKDQDFIKYVAGVSYRETDYANMMGFDELKPILEYSGEHITDEQNAEDYVGDSSGGRPNADSILIRLEIQHTDELTYVTGYTKNLTDEDSSFVVGGEYRMTDNLTWQASGVIFSGDDNTQFGRWRQNDNVEIGLTYSF